MTHEEYAKSRVVAELYRRQRRENERLRAALGQMTEERATFDREDREAFALVKMNRARLGI